jgi:hypothetical protein
MVRNKEKEKPICKKAREDRPLCDGHASLVRRSDFSSLFLGSEDCRRAESSLGWERS